MGSPAWLLSAFVPGGTAEPRDAGHSALIPSLIAFKHISLCNQARKRISGIRMRDEASRRCLGQAAVQTF
jgi:hypothetical protein